MISSTAEYALRAVVHLAMHPDAPCTSKEIAETTKAPPGYVSKVLQDLARAGLVVAQRGPNGGFSLALPPERISVLDAINAVDPIRRITTCPLGIPSHGTRLCRLHDKLDHAIAEFERVFRESTIADMIEPSRQGTRCLFPTVRGKPAAAPARRGPRARA